MNTSYDTWPEGIKPQSMTFTAVGNAKVFSSVFTGGQQAVGFPGDRFDASLTFSALNDTKYRKLSAWIASRRGPSEPFWLPHWGIKTPMSGYTGAISVSSDDQTGSTINLTFSDASEGDTVLCYGDFIQIGHRLHQVVAEVEAGSDLTADVSLAFPHPDATSTSDTVSVCAPECLMRLKDNTQGKFSLVPGIRATITINCTGVIF